MAVSLQFFNGLEGTKVTINSSPEPPFYFTTETWEIFEKLGEDLYASTEWDVADGLGPGKVIGKFLCRTEEDIAFMRIWKQVPTIGTEFQKPTVRASQAAEP
ncbi:hypothetical protein N7495_007109 [Penicillium taxi]|uniref:uncharacterized protein n=1 Tax=Penicillium taxi TaxID=168475 RepID=UPI002544F5EA|nr:uncharacterized protein N7495_007109 [Penicillium taxi]KAJ5895418.1 hypothetical protein N7495_007109 [Penicillium taxi]